MAPHEVVAFAHEAEREVAALFDFYGVAWAYEPRTFVLRADDDGTVRAAFTPDFHLPDFDLYVEVTTLEQRLVTRKNRKVRQLRERYPHIRVKVLYKRDVEHLASRFAAEG